MQALNLPKKVYFKTGCTPVALRELSEVYHCQRALLVTDPELYRAGIAAPVADLLRKQEIRVAEFFTVGKRVSFADLCGALPKLNEFQPDVIVGVGGNNAMSAAKTLLALYQEPGLDLAAAAAEPGRRTSCPGLERPRSVRRERKRSRFRMWPGPTRRRRSCGRSWSFSGSPRSIWIWGRISPRVCCW